MIPSHENMQDLNLGGLFPETDTYNGGTNTEDNSSKDHGKPSANDPNKKPQEDKPDKKDPNKKPSKWYWGLAIIPFFGVCYLCYLYIPLKNKPENIDSINEELNIKEEPLKDSTEVIKN